jgi:hypothetical protein
LFRSGSKEERTDPFPRSKKNGGIYPKPGGPWLDWVLCIRYLWRSPRWADRQRACFFYCPTRQIKGFFGRSSMQARWTTAATTHSAHVGRGGGRLGVSET